MARRVYISPTAFRVCRAGFDAATANLDQLIYSSDFASLGGSAVGEVSIPASSIGGPSSSPQPVFRYISLPPGQGIPSIWLWDAAPDAAETGYFNNSVRIYYDEPLVNLVFESRSVYPSHIGYLLFRNRF